MSRPGHTKLAIHIARLRRQALTLERTLARETSKRQMPCRCHEPEYVMTQGDFEDIRALYENFMESFRAEHREKQQAEMLGGADNVAS